MLLVQKQTQRSMEQNRGPRNKSTLTINWFPTIEARIHNGEKMISSISGIGKTGQLYEKKNLKWLLLIPCKKNKLINGLKT